MSPRPRIFLLDAGPVIRLHELGLWDALVERAEVIVPGIVASREVLFVHQKGEKRQLSIQQDATAGRIRIVDADAADLEATRLLFDPSLRDNVDPGEREALTLLRLWEPPRPWFCTADRLATIALCLLGLADCGISFETMLHRVGLGRPVSPRWFTEVAFQRWLEEGRRRHLMREGLA